MSRLDLTPFTPLGPVATIPLSAGSADILPVAQSTPGDGWAITGNNGRYALLLQNTDVGPQTVTVTSVERNGRLGHITTYSLAADDLAILGPFDAAGFNQADGRVHIEASDAAVLAAAISLPSSLFR